MDVVSPWYARTIVDFGAGWDECKTSVARNWHLFASDRCIFSNAC